MCQPKLYPEMNDGGSNTRRITHNSLTHEYEIFTSFSLSGWRAHSFALRLFYFIYVAGQFFFGAQPLQKQPSTNYLDEEATFWKTASRGLCAPGLCMRRHESRERKSNNVKIHPSSPRSFCQNRPKSRRDWSFLSITLKNMNFWLDIQEKNFLCFERKLAKITHVMQNLRLSKMLFEGIINNKWALLPQLWWIFLLPNIAVILRLDKRFLLIFSCHFSKSFVSIFAFDVLYFVLFF